MRQPISPLFHLHLCIGSLLLLLLFSVTLNAATVKIDFEDREATSEEIKNQYLQEYGVRFNSARICKPAKGTASGSKALSHATSLMEFSSGPLIIYFGDDGPQSRVRLAAGLNGKPPKPIDATMQAFDKNGQILKTITKKSVPAQLQFLILWRSKSTRRKSVKFG